jgi:hypothetical protein
MGIQSKTNTKTMLIAITAVQWLRLAYDIIVVDAGVFGVLVIIVKILGGKTE